MKLRILTLFMILGFVSCDPADLQRIIDGNAPLTQAEIARGLKEALRFGVDNSVTTLSATDGYYRSVYKILLPEEANVVIDKLSVIPGFTNLEEELVKKINRAAEDAASEAGPIFLDAISSITFDDALNILTGPDDAATSYLNNKTYGKLYEAFKPILVNSLNKFGALDYWQDAVTAYNKLPFMEDVNPDLADHINTEALDGLFALIEIKEAGIRNDISQRTTDLLRRVFARQDP